MKRSSLFAFTVVLWISCLFLSPLPAQVTRADYERAANLRNELQPLALNLPERPSWIDNTSRFWYRKTVKGGFEFQVMDAGNLARKPAFDHEKLAAALAQASKEKVDAMKLPFQMISFVDDERAVQFDFKGDRWKCDLTSYTVTRIGDAVPFGPSGDPMSIWVKGPAPQAASTESKTSPDGKWEAFILNYNVWVRIKEKKDEFALSQDGTEGDYYTYASITWSPDSKKIAAYRLRRGYHRMIRYVQSSPADQLQPKYISMEYAKPGDSLDVERPVLFLVIPGADHGMGGAYGERKRNDFFVHYLQGIETPDWNAEGTP